MELVALLELLSNRCISKEGKLAPEFELFDLRSESFLTAISHESSDSETS